MAEGRSDSCKTAPGWTLTAACICAGIDCKGSHGAPPSTKWNLIARRNHGPHIPCGAAIALACKIALGAKLPAGAMPCMGLLTVEEFLEPLRDLDISETVQ